MAKLQDIKKIRYSDWVWQELIAPQSVNILVGEQSRGKSMLALELTKQMLKTVRREYLNRPVKRQKVLYISTEMPEYLIAKRLSELGVDGRMKTARTDLDIMYIQSPTLKIIEDSISDTKATFVVIDIFGAVVSALGRDMNSYIDINDIVAKLKELTVKYNCTFLLIHHMNKAKTAMGSTATLSAMDTRFELRETSRDEENGSIVIYQTLNVYGKAVAAASYNVVFKYPNFEIIECEDDGAELDKPLSRLIEYIITYTNRSDVLEGTYQEVAAKARLIEKYQFSPVKLGRLIQMNSEVLESNNIKYVIERKTKARILKIWYDIEPKEDEKV